MGLDTPVVLLVNDGYWALGHRCCIILQVSYIKSEKYALDTFFFNFLSFIKTIRYQFFVLIK